ncbi:MAG: tetratricopeptide repeat protein, partial [Verrucomicrobia bacterium]|nr:tetratricopeptide repeat protein [Verrucomicrobiota bacterium]
MMIPRRLSRLLRAGRLGAWLLLCAVSAVGRGQDAAAPPSPPRRAGIGAERAAERYKQLLAANPSENTPLDRLWSLAEEAGSTVALLDEYARAEAAVDPKSGHFAPALIHGRLLQKAGRLDEAAAAFQRAAAVAPTNPQPLLALAALAVARHQLGEAVEHYQKAIAALPPDDPRATDVLLQLGDAFLQAGQTERAAEAWEKVVARDPRDLALRQRLAEAYETHGLPARAQPHLAWIESHATDPAARVGAARALARCAEAGGDFDTARSALERAFALTAPGNWLRADLATALRRLHERAGRLPELETRWREAAERAQRDLGAWQTLADFYAATGQPERERDALLRLIALAPRDKPAARRLAALHADLGEMDRAAAVLDNLLRAQPEDFELVLQRAGIELRQGKVNEAAARAEAACTRQPGDESRRAAALAFFQANHLPAAAERLLRADVARQPAADEPTLALARFFLAQKR